HTHLKNEISRFTQRFEETFSEAWECFKDFLRACVHHGFSELTQIDTLYNGLTEQDQDSLKAASDGNLLNKTTREALKIIENKSKVRYSRSKLNVSRVNINSRDNVSKTDDRIDKLADQISNLVEIDNKQVIAPAKAVEKTYVTYGGVHAYYECIATDSNPSSVYAATGSYNQVSTPNRASHQIPPPGYAPVQNNPNRDNVSKTDDRIDKLADQISNLVEIDNKQVIAPAKAVEKTYVTYGGVHAYYECIATDSNPSSVYAATGSYNQVSTPNRASHQIPPPGYAPVQNNPNRFNQNQGQGNLFNQENNFNQGNNFRGNNFQNNQGYRAQMNNALNFQNQGFQNQPFSVPNNQIPPSIPNEFSSYMKSNEIMIKSMQNQINSNTMPNPKGEMKVVTTCSGLAYEGPLIPTESSLEKVDEQNTKEILDKEHSNSSGSTAQVQPPVVPISFLEPDVPRTQTKPSIAYPSGLNDQKLREKANQMEKFFQIFHDLHFDISFADALLLMPKFASTIKSLLANKDKLFELAKVPLNENCSAMLLKKLPEKLGDPGKFLISCDFLRMEVCHALADLGASINLTPLSIWKKLSLPELTPTLITLELDDRSITHPKGVNEDVFVKVEKFCFPTDFVVVDFEANPRVPLILGRSFLRTGRALIDVYREEITLRVNDESITFNLNQTMRYSLTYDDTLVPIVKSSSPTLTLFGESDFFLVKIKDFLNGDSIPTGIETFVYDPEGDILFLEKLLNEDHFQLPLMDLKLAEESKEKSSIEEPPELELKELLSHLEYAFLEDSNKLPVIIAKNLKVDEREAILNVLKSHKRAISWKISDIKGIDPRFCTHKILMEDDYKPAVQSKEGPWVSPIHCVPKKGGMTVVANENNELIPTRLVTGWRVWNEFYCFLDGFSGYFQIPIDPQDQEKTTFTCPYRTFAYRRMPFGLCNAPGFTPQ
nr:reverse transcriptase domain-containing protein [Tanacetum cinerariifolium]